MLRRCLIPCLIVCSFISPLFAQVTADFSANITSGCSPVIVAFSDQSTGPVSSWFWDFGNGNTSTLQNPSSAYITPGQYSVSLTVSGSGTDTRTQTNFITVFLDPTANLMATSATGGCAPLTVSFQDQSLPGTGALTSWLWDFGDGQSSTQQNPSHTYSTGGNFAVTLLVTDNNGCSHTFTQANYINVSNQPTADFAPNTPQSACTPPFTVNFTDLSTGGGSGFTYLWQFGDGGTSTAANPSHTYTANGTYTVTLIITDQNGCEDTLVRPNWVDINPVNTDFNAFTISCVGQPIQFYDQTSGSPVSWSWNFGDGGVSNIQNPVHAYNSVGTYTVSLTSSLGPGCSGSEVKTGYITITPGPTANFGMDTTESCDVPFTVSFFDSTAIGGLGLVSWFWDFGDSTYSNQQNPVHTYTTFGSDTVTLTVTDAGGCSSTFVINDAVTRIPVEAAIFASPQNGCIPETVNFTDLSSSGSPIVSWFWDFGDGTTSTLQNPSHTYTVLGRYDITLIVVNSLGCTDTIVEPAYIAVGTPPVMDLTAFPVSACASDPVQFTSLASPADEWSWSFGDGMTSELASPTHLYRDTGYFDVRFSVAYFGCWVDTLIPNFIYRDAPVSRFGWNPNSACNVPFTANFTDNSIAPDTWFWKFGDGTTSSIQNPSHTYTASGNYTVTLYVTNAATGCIDSSSQVLPITIPNAGFLVLGNRAGCFPFTVSFLNNSTSTVPIIEYYWDFGDGDTSRAVSPMHTYLNQGVYTVTLTIEDANGCIQTLTRTNYIAAVKPTANFSATPINGCDPLTVDFTDLSTPDPPSGVNITAWHWHFGDGTTSNLQNPQHTYTNPGTYSIILIITDGLGCRDTLTRFNYITVNSLTASFSISETLACEGYPIQFTNSTPGLFLNYFWDFGDGNGSNLPSPTHTYTTEDTFEVSLIILDPYGCRDTVLDTVEIVNPVANFSANPTSAACPPLYVNFTDLSLPTNRLSSWTWDFGDGNSSVVQNPGNLYATAGVYDVSLIVELIPGCIDTLLLPNLIDVQGPSGSFWFTPDSGCTPLAVQFFGTAQNSVSYTWDFGDGTIITGTADTVVHAYTQTGIFYPSFILDDGLGCTFPIVSPDSVDVDTVPFPDFSIVNANLCGPDSVYFTDLSISTGPLTGWYWDFGDGSTSTLQNPVHYYANPGMYDVKLVVTNRLGCVDSIIKPAEVRFFTPPTADFLPLDTLVCPNSLVPFLDQSTGNYPILQWAWNFGNGTGSTQQNPMGVFGNTGVYTVRLVITDSVGCTDTVFAPVNVSPGPTAAFTADDSIGCFPLHSLFTGNAGTGIISWAWNLGNGNTPSGNPVTTTYSDPGYYTVSLIVTDTLGCLDTLVKTDYVFVDSIVANFGSDGDIGCPPYLVNFFDSSYSDTTLSYFWEFGDGNTSTLPNPSHSYTTPGVFTVRLIITSPAGCTDTISRQVVEVYNNFPSDPIEIYRVTVRNNYSTHLTWKPHPGYGFSHYVIYAETAAGSGVFLPIDSLYNRLDTTYRHNGLTTRSNVYCYKLVVVDVCGYRSSLAQAEKHCSIDVTATPGNQEINVSWTPYVGFDNIDRYEVYQVMNYDTTQVSLMTSVNGNTTSIIDSNLFCGLQYCYRIRAVEAGGNQQVSWSDTSCAIPEFPNENTMEMVRATVEQNEDVLVEWKPVPFNYAIELELERSLDNQNWSSIQTLPPQALGFLDQNVNVQGQSYYYRITALDSCGSRTQLGNHARSILLKADLQTYTPYLFWNPYSQWANGVDQYSIEVLNESTSTWDLVENVGGMQVQYWDKVTDLPQAELCYRVRAEEEGGNQAVSLSNEACVLVGPVLYAPSGFTPNGDGTNDFFELKGSFIRSFKITIYNRWGKKIFESHSLQDSWAGIHLGQPVQEGVYVFRAEAVGDNGAQIEKKGTVTLIR